VNISTPVRPAPIPATDSSIAAIVAEIQGTNDPFLILGGDDQQRYMQALETPTGFVLDFQEGSIDQHYRTKREDLSSQEIIDAFRQYLAWGGKGRPAFDYERIELRRPSYRVGFSLGNLVGRLVRFFRGGV
jgi:serine/threonine protein kinase HipA of HipAB toxin-antitoxin module